MKKKFFITTPIYYANSVPHIGHAYSSLIADVIARYKRDNWFDVKFSTWVDENWQKMVNAAKEKWISIMEFLDDIATKQKAVWDWIDISYTDFIRTTELRHHEFVSEVLQKTYDAWDIYKWEYEWLYCVWCEAFKKETDLTPDWLCPDHLKKPEKNYFFKLSKYQKQLEDFYLNNPDFTIPNNRFKEMQSFLKEWLEDFSISRETNKFWIPLPFDPSQVTYVWYDALLNYLTVCQNWAEDFWPADLHVVGKEIARFHVIYWPAMLLSAWYELPKNVLVTWFITIDWQKISKSIWNVIDPVEFSGRHSRDLMLLYLLSTFPIWQDWDFSEAQAILMYNAKLANNIGNLLNRFLVLGDKFFWKDEISGKLNENIEDKRSDLIQKYFENMNNYILKDSLEIVFEFWDALNKFLDETKPWNKNIETDKEELRDIMFTLWEWLRTIAILLHPFFYKKMTEIFSRIWLDYSIDENEMKKLLDKIEGFTIKEKWDALYPRI